MHLGTEQKSSQTDPNKTKENYFLSTPIVVARELFSLSAKKQSCIGAVFDSDL